MTIHLAATAFNFENDLPYLREIQRIIAEGGHKLSLDWIDSTRSRLEKGEVKNEDLDWTRVVNEHLDSISRADLVIVEASAYSFHHGFQSAYALMKRKPTLFLYREQTNNKSLSGLYASGITNEHFLCQTYHNLQDLHSIVDKFLSSHSQAKRELSLQIDTDLEEYLSHKADKSGMTKSAVIRELLLNDQGKSKGDIR